MRGAVAIGLREPTEDYFVQESFNQRRAASWSNREKTLREAGFSLRAGVRDLGAFLRQNHHHAKRLLDEYEGVMSLSNIAPADSAAVKCELAGEVLRSFGELRFAATGWSMLPAIWPGDILVVERVGGDHVRAGEVVLVGRDGRLCAHRVVSREGLSGYWVTQGDAMLAPDLPVTDDQLLGRVVYLLRAGERVAVPTKLSLVARLTAMIIRHSFLAARVLVYLRRVYLHRFVQTSEKSGPEGLVSPCRG